MKNFKKAIIIACLSLSVNVSHAQENNYHYSGEEALIDTTLTLDFCQTMDIKHHDGIYERNRILGSHPSDGKIIAYFATIGVGNHLVMQNLSPEWRTAWTVGIVAAELQTIIKNKKIGLKFSF
jgi:hypothetical protein